MRLTLISIIFIFLSACTLNFSKEGMTEGVMKYKIKYLQNESENPLISLMPSTLDMTFKNNSVLMEVEGWMGVFKSSFVKKGSGNKAINMLKMMGKKYYYISENGAGFMGMAGSNIDISFTENTKTIIDFECKHGKGKINDNNVEFDIYYTSQIGITNPNQFTPFEKVPGVLMEFYLEINGIQMQLEAIEINECEIDDKIFEIPEGYEEVDKSKIDEIFSSLL